MPLSQVIANDRAYKLKQDSQREEQKDVSDFVAFLLPFGTKRQNKELSSSNSSLSSTSETPNESTSPNTPEPAPRARRRVSSTSHGGCDCGSRGSSWTRKNLLCVWTVEYFLFEQWVFSRGSQPHQHQKTLNCSGNLLLLMLVGKDHTDSESL